MKTLFAAFFALIALATAAFSGPNEGRGEFRLLKGWVEPDGTRVAALEITLDDGWKTYWRAPGDAGVPLQVNWAGSRNLGGAELRWPRPHIYDQDGFRTIGYKKRLVLPIVVTPKHAGKPVKLKGAFDLGVCSDICIPVHVRLEEVLPAEGVHNQAAIAAALKAQPVSAAAAGVRALSCTLRPHSDGLELTVTMQLASLGGAENAAIETGDPLVWAKQPQVSRKGQSLSLRTTLVHALEDSFAISREQLRITLLGRQRAVDIQGCG